MERDGRAVFNRFLVGAGSRQAGPAGGSCGAVTAPGSAPYSSTTAPPSGVYSSTLQLHPRAGSIILSEIMYRHTPHTDRTRAGTLRRRRAHAVTRARSPPARAARAREPRAVHSLLICGRPGPLARLLWVDGPPLPRPDRCSCRSRVLSSTVTVVRLQTVLKLEAEAGSLRALRLFLEPSHLEPSHLQSSSLEPDLAPQNGRQ